MTFALIPAAGKSTRMGRPKLSLPVGKSTVLELVIGALREAGVAHILVVIGPHVNELEPLALAAGAELLRLDHETADMRATVIQGLSWLEERFHPKLEDDWLLVPADHPTLDAPVISQILQARRERPEYSIIVPNFQGRRGHPTLISWRHVEEMRALPEGVGLNSYLRSQRAKTLELPVGNENVLFDLDTPEDYEKLKLRRRKSSRH